MAHHDSLPPGDRETGLLDASAVERCGSNASARLHLMLRDAATGAPLAGLVRVTPSGQPNRPLRLAGLYERPGGWFSMAAEAEMPIPEGRYRIEAVRGLDTLVTEAEADCALDAVTRLTLRPIRFYNLEAKNLRAVNTHLHLLLNARRKMGVELNDRRQADAYVETIGASDGLDLVFLSYLTQRGVAVVSNDYTEQDFNLLSRGPTRFQGGIEHRHGGRRVPIETRLATGVPDGKPARANDNPEPVISYGHVLLFNLANRILPASIGPGMAEEPDATDGIPLRRNISTAQDQGGGAIWCHGAQGLERIADWLAGLLDAQNIYDGGNDGTFDSVYYPLLNAGLNVSFSTGTDWGVWDFSRVYVSTGAPPDSRAFLRELAAGRTFITNEPLLEFSVNGWPPGETVHLPHPGRVRIRGRAVCRSDFVRLQLIYDGRIVQEVVSRPLDGHFIAELDQLVDVTDSGWLALRISPQQPYFIRAEYVGPGINILGKPIFAHTSAVYIEVAGRARGDPAAINSLIEQVRAARSMVNKDGIFVTDQDREALLRIYTEAEAMLHERLSQVCSRPIAARPR